MLIRGERSTAAATETELPSRARLAASRPGARPKQADCRLPPREFALAARARDRARAHRGAPPKRSGRVPAIAIRAAPRRRTGSRIRHGSRPASRSLPPPAGERQRPTRRNSDRRATGGPRRSRESVSSQPSRRSIRALRARSGTARELRHRTCRKRTATRPADAQAALRQDKGSAAEAGAGRQTEGTSLTARRRPTTPGSRDPLLLPRRPQATQTCRFLARRAPARPRRGSGRLRLDPQGRRARTRARTGDAPPPRRVRAPRIAKPLRFRLPSSCRKTTSRWHEYARAPFLWPPDRPNGRCDAVAPWHTVAVSQ